MKDFLLVRCLFNGRQLFDLKFYCLNFCGCTEWGLWGREGNFG